MGCLLNNHTGDFWVCFFFYIDSQSCQFSQDCSRNPLSRLLHLNHSIHLFTWRHRNNPIICLFYTHRPQYDFGVTSCHFYSILISVHTFLTPIRMSQPEYLPLQREKQCACSQMVKIPIFNQSLNRSSMEWLRFNWFLTRTERKKQLHGLCLFPWRPINLNGINEYICDIFICSSQAW